MATRIKPSDVKPKDGPDPAAVRKVVNECRVYKEKAQSATGELGSTVSTFCEATGISRKTLGWIRALDALKDPAKQQQHIREFSMLCAAMGYFDQQDLFNPISAAAMTGEAADEADEPDEDGDQDEGARDEKASGPLFTADDDDDGPPKPAADEGKPRTRVKAGSKLPQTAADLTPKFDDAPVPNAKATNVKAAADRAEARSAKGKKADVVDADAAKRAAVTAQELADAPNVVEGKFTDRLRKQNDAVEAEIRGGKKGSIDDDVNRSLGAH